MNGMTLRRVVRFAVVGGLALSVAAPLTAAEESGKMWGAVKSILTPNQPNSGAAGALGAATSSMGLSADTVAKGLIEALRVGTGRVVDQVSKAGGYLDDQAIHIPLPPQWQSVQGTLKKVGLASVADDLENRMNAAAEAAAPEARDLFIKALSDMTMDDAMAIYNGPKDAATQYFQQHTRAALVEKFRPVIDAELAKVGALQLYDQLTSSYAALPLIPDIKADMVGWTVDKGLEGLFHYLAVEEAAIRDNPAKRTTDLLKQVFGAS